MNEFKDAKEKQSRGTSVKQAIESTLEQSDDINTIVISCLMDDGTVETAFSWDSSLEAIGILDISKQEIRDSMFVEE